MDKEIISCSKKHAIKMVEKVDDEMIHCFIGTLGADWDKKSVIRYIEKADKVGWVKNIFNHNLAILIKGTQYNFDIIHKQLI